MKMSRSFGNPFLLVVLLIGGGQHTMASNQLSFPSECADLDCELNFGAVRVETPTATFTTRGFNGGVPGPTIRVAAGDALKVRLVNSLEDVDNEERHHNVFHKPNTTNLHTHGLHVSSAAPGDDIFVHVGPRESYDYEYEIPPDHMGGTHFYHPHAHGSTALQAGGGAAGLLIVDDAPGEVPPEVVAMPEVPLMLTLLDVSTLQAMQGAFNTDLWQVDGAPSGGLLLANGQANPTLDVFPGVWYRFRIAYAAIVSPATFSFLGDGSDDAASGCEMQLLAKDGIYLATAPRLVTELPLFSGARADVAVRCERPGNVSLAVTGGAFVPLAEAAALTLNVAGAHGRQPDLPEFVVKRPCYVADARRGTPDVTSSLSMFGLGINEKTFSNSTTYVDTFDAGSLVEIRASGINFHVLHVHVNPFQIFDVDDDTSDANPYFQDGDFHDSILLPAGAATLRMYTDYFVGKAVVHCHLLNHEDFGMMGVYRIAGQEGTVYEPATDLDPTCYRQANAADGRGFFYSTPRGAESEQPSPAPTLIPTPVPTSIKVY